MPGRTLQINGKRALPVNGGSPSREKLRSEVLAETGRRVSHEFRTTLAVIRESASLLREEKSLSIQQIRVLEILIRNVQRLSGFVAELLAKAESKK